MDWLRVLSYYSDALTLERDKAEFQARIAGAKIRSK